MASVYEGATADGMNEKGLVANLLYLAESEYPAAIDTRPAVTICAWTQYVLDRFTTAAEAVADVFSVMRNVGVPRGITTPDKPNVSSTIWRTVSDQKQRIYYYESTYSPSAVWVKFADLDFAPESGVRKLQLDGEPDRAGNQTREFKPAEPFRFLRPK